MALVALALPACNEDVPVGPMRISGAIATGNSPGVIPALQPGDSAAADSLARFVAIALSDESLRRALFEDLRDSPFPQHRIHLSSYLRGSRGVLLADKVSRATGISRVELARLASVRGGLQIVLRRSVDRLSWRGTADIAVKGISLTLGERGQKFRSSPGSEIAYSVLGTPMPHGILTDSKYPFLEITAAETDFGADPEAKRSAAAKQVRNTVGTIEEELAVYRQRGDSSIKANGGLTPRRVDECPPEGCGDGGPPRPTGVSIPSGKNYGDCFRPGYFDQTVDRDQDGVDDGCEYELAAAFRPQMVFMSDDCDTRRAPHFAVRQSNSPDWGGVIYIFYALSYVYDCGPAFSCPILYPDCNPHAGDSEWIILEVGPSPSGSTAPWALKYGTLSAHWRTSAESTAGYPASALEDAEYSPAYGAPRIWAAQNKHSNYRTENDCDEGGFAHFDNCDRPSGNYYTLDFESSHNLGHEGSGSEFIGSYPLTPVSDRITSTRHYTEFYWESDRPFCGWSYYNAACAGAYYESLQAYGFALGGG
ncbi:MAG: hypothetical protein WKF55_01675 [Gemmatimonadaceae bacterium]